MISVNGQQIGSLQDFSLRFQDMVSLIAGANAWLVWALASSTGQQINVATESQLLEMIQVGLNSDAYIRFDTFRATIEKISVMSDADVRQLSVMKGMGNEDSPALSALLQRNNIITYAQIAAASQWLTSAKLDGNTVFSAMSFGDWLNLAAFCADPLNLDSKQQAKAYSFAVDNASTVNEFIHLACFYEWMTQNSNSKVTSVADAQSLYNNLLPLTYGYLFTPNVGSVLDGPTLRAQVSKAAGENGFFGYGTPSAATLNLAMNININDLVNWQKMTGDYLGAVKQMVSTNEAASYNLAQDGSQATLTFNTASGTVVIVVDREGNACVGPESKLNTN